MTAEEYLTYLHQVARDQGVRPTHWQLAHLLKLLKDDKTGGYTP